MALEQAAEVIDLYPYNGGYSVMGVDSDSAVGLLGLLLFIDLLRVTKLVENNLKSLIFLESGIRIPDPYGKINFF